MFFYTIQGKADAQHQPVECAVAEYAVVDKSKKKYAVAEYAVVVESKKKNGKKDEQQNVSSS